MPLTAIPNQAGVFDIVLNQGADYQAIATIKLGGIPIDLTGITPRAKVRPDFVSATILTLTCAVYGSPANGQVIVSATPALIAAITPPSAPTTQREIPIGEWDLELTDGTLTGRFLQGNVTLSREATI